MLTTTKRIEGVLNRQVDEPVLMDSIWIGYDPTARVLIDRLSFSPGVPRRRRSLHRRTHHAKDPMILTDNQIASSDLIRPFRREQLNPASYDLLIGPDMLLETEHGLTPYNLANTTQDQPFMLDPGGFCLLHSQETFDLPHNVAAKVALKSSRAREGYDHLLAGWCDPGWNGSVLTLAIKNQRQFAQLPTWCGMRMVQIVFMFCIGAVDRPYQGRYNGDTTVSASKG
jgi:dCTP deaminase